ncbi:uncharacterized protein LOC119675978 [Teleopsis dalmanni]|uniref:uncharacterized protein LOC119675978 n=1 Tax=Teleopsis dalmanni TaxID=139649 RepID=UPI0018CF2D24|nr:uncharacterized protein LOC119675978 [Teleopsis dalmanni]
MYRQIWVSTNNQKYQHILWRSEINQPIEEYKLTTVTYGIAPASFLAIRTLFEIANECQDNQISKIIKDDFYMDDLLTGSDTKEECKSVQRRISAHLEKYGFHLRKWCSNSMDIIETVEKSNQNEVIDIDKEENQEPAPSTSCCASSSLLPAALPWCSSSDISKGNTQETAYLILLIKIVPI